MRLPDGYRIHSHPDTGGEGQTLECPEGKVIGRATSGFSSLATRRLEREAWAHYASTAIGSQ